MAKVGRNDLCPCGSGKKYKNCCMVKNQTKVMIDEELEKFKLAEGQLSSLIMKHARSEENEPDFEKAVEKFFDGELSEINISDVEFSFFMSWYIKNYNFDNPFINKVIQNESRNQSVRIRQLLNSLKESGMYLYKIKKIQNSEITIENLHTGEESLVIDEILEHNINVDDVIYTRIYKTGRYSKLFGGSILIPYFMVDRVLSDIDKSWNSYENKDNFDEFLQKYSLSIIKKLNEDILNESIIYNEDNELLQYSTVIYNVLDKNKCRFILDNALELTKALDEEELVYQWGKNEHNSDFVMGEITLTDNELKVETDSFERKMKLQSIIEKKLKNYIEFKTEDYFTLSQLKEETNNLSISEELKNSEEIERLILDNMKTEYTPLQIRDAMLLAKKHKSKLKRLKPESVVAAIEYIIATKENLSKTQKDIADKYNVSPATVGKRAKEIQEANN